MKSVRSSEFGVRNAERMRNILPRTPNSELRTSNGAPLLEQARRYLVGGVNSPVRAFRYTGGEPLMLTRARGAEVVDHEGRAYLDFIMGWGALLLGHSPPVVSQTLRRGLAQGTLMGLTHPAEVELARLVAEAVPSVEQVRFTVSGTEACMTAVRLARAHTGRTKILTLDGCYHGHGDSLMAGKTAGIPELSARDAICIPFNDPGALERAFERHGDELACVILEPVAANMGVIPPEPRYLSHASTLARAHGALLIFDEVVTGFRLGLGGAQAAFGIRPDLTTFGKIVGGGLPIGALGGPRRLMRRLAPEGDVYHGGTFAGHPLSMAAGIATLRALKAQPPYQALDRLAGRLINGLRDAAERSGVAVQINRAASMFTMFFSETPVRNFAQTKASRTDRFAQWAQALRAQAILIPPSPFEALFLSTRHTGGHIERLIEASSAAFKRMK